MHLNRFSSADENSALFQKSLYYTFFYGIISFVLVLVALLLLYVTCSRKYRLNWFEKNLLERANNFDFGRSENEAVSVTTEYELGSNRSISNLTTENKFWVPLQHARSSSSINECSLGESTAAHLGSRNSIASTTCEENTDNEAKPIARNDKQVVLCTTKPARPRVSSMNTKLDHTKINSTFYQEIARSPSISEVTSGSVNISISYDHAVGILSVRLIQAKDLLPRDFSGTSDPYAKIRLLPDLKNVWQTRIHKKTVNPVFDEDFVFEVPSLSLDRRTLEIILYDFDAYSRHLSLGEVRLALSEFDLSEKVLLWRALEPCSEPHKKMRKKEQDLGRRFGRPDIERCDIFIDPGILDWGEYSGKPACFNDSAEKGVQMLSSVPSGGHKKCGIQKLSGYFDPEFVSLSVNEPYREQWKMSWREESHPIAGPWIPVHPASTHASPGDNYGTFTTSADYKAFSPLTRPEKVVGEKGLKNFLINPPKKGNSGYPDICINKFPPYILKGKADPYYAPALLYSAKWKEHKKKILNGPLKVGFYPGYFDENPFRDTVIGPTYVQPVEKKLKPIKGIFYPPAGPKKPGNNHDGCFDKFPSWSPEPYITAREVEMKMKVKPPKSGEVFKPIPGLKSYYTVSVVKNKIDIACNERTFRTMKPISYPQFNT